MSDHQEEKSRKFTMHIYVLPNLVTTGNIFFGFYSIIQAINGKFTWAAYAIVIASFFDLLDGRLARLTRSTSKFGAEYDSLCDLVSFGLAPALLLYLWSLQPFGRVGWLAAFLYVTGGALRLARFNVQAHVVEKSYFQGLPIPMAAGIVASSVLAFSDLGWDPEHSYILLFMTFLLAGVMVSTFRYRSFKDLDLKERLPFRYLVIAVGILTLVAYHPEVNLFLLFLSYATLGAISGVLRFGRNKKIKPNVYLPEHHPSEQDLVLDEEEEKKTNIHHLVLFFLLLGSLLGNVNTAYATITLVDYSKYFAKVDVSPTDAKSITIYAGRTSTACPSEDGSNTCNSCASLGTLNADPSPVCNNNQIYSTLPFVITLKSDNTAININSKLGLVYNNIRQNSSLFTVTGTMGPNSNLTLSIPWGELCNLAEAGDCTGSFSKTFLFGFDKDGESGATALTEYVTIQINFRYVSSSNNQTWCLDPNVTPSSYEGLCAFTVYPGDEKIYMTNVNGQLNNDLKVENLESGPSGQVDDSKMVYTSARVYYFLASDSSNLNLANAKYVDLPMTTSGLNPSKIEGLSNGQQYVFVTANVDQAGNVTYFSGLNDLVFDDGCQTSGCGTTQSATPEPVYGLLDGKKCFIATAAFGSPLEPEVQELRQFRDHFLLNHSIGKFFVSEYYKYSPIAAKYLEDHPAWKPVVRVLLIPAIALAHIVNTLNWSFLSYLAIAFSLLCVLSVLTVLPMHSFFLSFLSFSKSLMRLHFVFVFSLFFATPTATQAVEVLNPEGGTYQIPHPGSEKGLYLIDKKKVYHYEVEVKEKNQSTLLRFFYVKPPVIKNTNGNTYKSMYGTKDIYGFMGSYEWQPFRGFGALGIQIGMGLTLSKGTGVLASSGIEAKEQFNLFIVPLDLFLVYRLELMTKQWVVPFIIGGMTYYGLAEKRDDNKPAQFAGAPTAGGGGGVHISITRWDSQTVFNLSREYGITDLWLTLEGRVMKSFKSDIDFSNTLLSAGFAFDY